MSYWLDCLNDRLLGCVALVTGLAIAAGTGCDRAASSTAATKQAAARVQKAAADRLDQKIGKIEGGPQPPAVESIDPSDGTAQKPLEGTGKSSGAGGSERIAILMPGGPLLVDVCLMLDGRPHTVVFDELVQQVIVAGDTDQDGQPTWRELASNKEFVATQPGTTAAGGGQLTMWTERFDENRDGRIQPREAAAWLGRDVGASARPFAVRSSRSYLSIPSANSRVWQLLDTDRSAALSAAEISAASAKLLALDANDDRVISTAELATLREQLEAQGNRLVVGRNDARYAAIHLESGFDPERLEYLLSDLYAPRQILGPSSFPEFAGLYEPLDANGDDWLEQRELAELLTTDPHLSLIVAFNKSPAPNQRLASMQLQDHLPEVSVLAMPSVDRVVLTVGGTRLILSAHDLTAGQASDGSTEPAVAGSQIRMMVHDQCDALFEALDENADGRLGEREIAACPDRLLDQETDGDGQLAASELRYPMIVAFLRGESPAEQSFYVPAVAPTAEGDGAIAGWFAHADFNGDGDVSRREFVGPEDQFARLDANGDGYVSRNEAANAGEE